MMTRGETDPQFKRITLCVDDFGSDRSVNSAVSALARLRRLNAVSCMVGGVAWEDGVHLLDDLDTQATDIGLHLDFTHAPRRRSAPWSLPALIAAAHCGALDTKAVRAEIEAQLGAFEESTCRMPDFIDGHQHVHQLPVVRELLVEIVRSRYPHARPWIRSTRRPVGASAAGTVAWQHALKSRVIEALGDRAMGRLARSRGLVRNRHLLGSYGVARSVATYRRFLACSLHLAQDGDLLMCHPRSNALASDPCGLNEFIVLTGPDFGTLLRAAGVVLAPLDRRPGAPWRHAG